MDIVQRAIELILHKGLRKYKFTNSKATATSITNQEKFERKVLNGKKNKKGSIFITRKKEDLSTKFGTSGVVLSSEEAVLNHIGQASHWTPNVYNFGTYHKKGLRIIVGHTEMNLQQINCFVIDIDSKAFPISAINDVALNTGFGVPTMILETTKGYQVYYVLDRAVYVSNNNNFVAIKSAKRISQNLRKMFADSLPDVDLTCNHFGFFRMPSVKNILMFCEKTVYTFKELQEWSKRQDDNKEIILFQNKKKIPHEQPKQMDESWFTQIINFTNISPKHTKAGRNNAIFTLSLACFQSQYAIKDTMNLMDEFNSKLEKPLNHTDVKGIVMSAYSGKYQAAHKNYIEILIKTYGINQQISAYHTPSTIWIKHKKQRRNRIRSHWYEWETDLLNFLSKNATNKPILYYTQVELCTALNIPRSTLNTVLKKSKKIYKVVKGKGRTAKTGLSTIKIIIESTLKEKETKRNKYLKYLQELPFYMKRNENSENIKETYNKQQYNLQEGLPAG